MRKSALFVFLFSLFCFWFAAVDAADFVTGNGAELDITPFVGQDAGTEDSNNTFYGINAGHPIPFDGTGDTFIGVATGNSNTTGSWNTFLGGEAGKLNTSGNRNTFVGSGTGFSNTTGSDNTMLGYNAGRNNTTAAGNIFLGGTAGYSNTVGSSNIFIGRHAGFNNTTANNNTFLGRSAGYSNATGYGNIFLGYNAGYNETGSNKLYIDNSDAGIPLIYGEFDNDIVAIRGKLGVGTKAPAYPVEVVRTGSNASIVLNRTDGAKNYVNATPDFGNFGTVNNFPLRLTVNSLARLTLNSDNSLVMKSGASCTAGGVWTNNSTIAMKENISSLGSDEAAATLQSLNPVKYNYKAEKDQKHVGFIAEEVPDLVAMKDRKSLSPMDIVAVLAKVTQDQQKTIADLTLKMQEQQQFTQAQILEQQRINENLKTEIAELKNR